LNLEKHLQIAGVFLFLFSIFDITKLTMMEKIKRTKNNYLATHVFNKMIENVLQTPKALTDI
jgi:transposase-like protein